MRPSLALQTHHEAIREIALPISPRLCFIANSRNEHKQIDAFTHYGVDRHLYGAR